MIHLKNINKSFNNKIALKNLNLKINSGEIYGLLGANGAGKSTTINLLLGFTKADNGEIKMIDSKDESKIRKIELDIYLKMSIYTILEWNREFRLFLKNC